jgi:hypothetical protein
MEREGTRECKSPEDGLGLKLLTFLGCQPLSWDHAEVARQFRYKFEWDPTRARNNLRNHWVAFECATIFLDEEENGDEDRWIP